jgi:hypothetical protein
MTQVVNGSLTGVIDGTNKAFNLSAVQIPPGPLLLTINGIAQFAYAFSGTEIVLETAPLVTDVISATYQTGTTQ